MNNKKTFKEYLQAAFIEYQVIENDDFDFTIEKSQSYNSGLITQHLGTQHSHIESDIFNQTDEISRVLGRSRLSVSQEKELERQLNKLLLENQGTSIVDPTAQQASLDKTFS